MKVDPALILADKIEIHLALDKTPGYFLSVEDQKLIVECLRFTVANQTKKNDG